MVPEALYVFPFKPISISLSASSIYCSVAIVLSPLQEVFDGKLKPYPHVFGFNFPVISKLPSIFLSAIFKLSPLYYMNISVIPTGYTSIVSIKLKLTAIVLYADESPLTLE